MFSSASFNSISFATVTPSLVIVGEPNFLSITTLRPFWTEGDLHCVGELIDTAQNRRARVLTMNYLLCHLFFLTTFLSAAAGCAGAFEDSENLVLAHDEKLFAVDLDLRAAVLAEKNAIALFHVEGLAGAVFFIFAFADSDDFAFLGFFLGGVGDDDAAPHLLALFDSLHDDAIMKRPDVRCHDLGLLSVLLKLGFEL